MEFDMGKYNDALVGKLDPNNLPDPVVELTLECAPLCLKIRKEYGGMGDYNYIITEQNGGDTNTLWAVNGYETFMDANRDGITVLMHAVDKKLQEMMDFKIALEAKLNA